MAQFTHVEIGGTAVHLNRLALEDILRRALVEDVGYGDITSEAILRENLQATAVITVKQNGVICGHPIAEAVLQLLSEQIRYERLADEGAEVTAGTVVARVSGSARAMLTGERVALNFMQRLSGITTQTRRLTERIKYYKAKLVATRQTAPGLRLLDRYAVAIGGGGAHRFGLSDGVLIRDNHIAISGGIRQAVTQARRAAPFTVKVEVEVEALSGVEEALTAGADIILLKNMEPDLMKQAVDLIAGKVPVEASGRIAADQLEEVAATGVDYVSLGWLTQSPGALDISLDIVGAGHEGDR